MPDKEISEESKEIDSIVIPASQHERAEEVTSKLLELQKKHKEISDRVQSVLIDTVDFAFGAAQTGSLKDTIQEIASAGDYARKPRSAYKRPYQPTKDAIRAAKKKKAMEDQRRKKKQQAEQEHQMMLDNMAYTQGVGSVPYGLPCLAVTRRNQVQQYQQYEVERVNMKLCQIMRAPADFVDVEQESEESEPDLDDSYDDESADEDDFSGSDDDNSDSQDDIQIEQDNVLFGEPLQ